MAHVDAVGLVDLADEESVVGQELLGVNCRLVQEHSGDDSGDLVSIHRLNGGINTVTDEVLSIFTLDLVEAREINWWELKGVLLLLLLVLELLVTTF